MEIYDAYYIFISKVIINLVVREDINNKEWNELYLFNVYSYELIYVLFTLKVTLIFVKLLLYVETYILYIIKLQIKLKLIHLPSVYSQTD